LGLTLAIAAWAVPRWGAAGAALATSAAYLLTMAWVLPAFRRRHRGALQPGRSASVPDPAAPQSAP
jgi:Na+-driven multidrug efflux pump